MLNKNNDTGEKLKAEHNIEIFKMMINKCPFPMAIASLDTGETIDINNHFEHWTGYTKEEFLSIDTTGINFYVNIQDRKYIVNELIKKGIVNNFELWIYKKNNKKTLSLFNAELHEIDGKKIIVSTMIELTEKNILENLVEENKEKFRYLFDNSENAIFIWHVNNSGIIDKLIESNASASEYTGYSSEELNNLLPCDIIPGEINDQTLFYYDEKKILQNNSTTFESLLKKKDGTTINVEISYQFFKLNNETAVLSIIKKLSDRKSLEAKLKLTEFCVDNASVGIIRTDSSGKIKETNKYICKLLGYSESELVEKYIYQIDPLFNRQTWSDHRKNLRKTGSDTFETFHKTKDDKEIPVEITNTYINYLGEEFSFSFIRDITERRLAEEEIKNSLKEKEILLKEIHHRVKNNLQIVSSLLFLQAQQLQGSQVAELFKVSQNRVKTIELIHENLYRSSDPVKIDFEKYMNSLVLALKESFDIDNNSIQIKVNAEKIHLDINKAIPCGLILNELITNSIKHAFTKNNKGLIEIELRLDNLDYYLLVRDNGCGLPEAFDINELKSLGLRVVENLVKQLNGKLKYNNDSGTNFKIKFPAEG